MDSNLRKWCWNRTENILSMFYEHKEIHKFWVKKVITKRKNILAVNLAFFIAERIIQQDTGTLLAQPSLLAALQAAAGRAHQQCCAFPPPAHGVYEWHSHAPTCQHQSVTMEKDKVSTSRGTGEPISLHCTNAIPFYLHPLEPTVDPWEDSGISASNCSNKASPKLGHGQKIWGLIWNPLKLATRALRVYHLQPTAKTWTQNLCLSYWQKERPFPEMCATHLKKQLCSVLEGISASVPSQETAVRLNMLKNFFCTQEEHFWAGKENNHWEFPPPSHRTVIFVQNSTHQNPWGCRSWQHVHRAHATGTAAPHNYRAQTFITPLEGLSKGKEEQNLWLDLHQNWIHLSITQTSPSQLGFASPLWSKKHPSINIKQPQFARSHGWECVASPKMVSKIALDLLLKQLREHDPTSARKEKE